MMLMLSTFMLVFLRAFQQQNVIHANFRLAALTSYMLAIAEVATVLWMVKQGWSSVLWVGTGGACGVTSSMYIYRRHFKK
jgi:hypothetical protein